jgi:hypothetical protein
MSEGPTILWGLLKGKKAKTNDGKDIGKIDKVSLELWTYLKKIPLRSSKLFHGRHNF